MIQRNVEFNDEQPKYRYLKQKNGLAEVYIYKKISESTDEDGNTIFLYDMNTFNVDPQKITEEMIKDNPMRYFNYDTKNPSILERLETIENAFAEMAGEFYG